MQNGELERISKSVVVVDSDPAVLGALKFALELEGFGVTAFRSGTEALAQRNLPLSGCLVTDFNLADMSGLDLVASLRDRAVQLPAILLTSDPPARLRRRAAAAGMQIVEKPLLGDTLGEAIREALSDQPAVLPR